MLESAVAACLTRPHHVFDSVIHRRQRFKFDTAIRRQSVLLSSSWQNIFANMNWNCTSSLLLSYWGDPMWLTWQLNPRTNFAANYHFLSSRTLRARLTRMFDHADGLLNVMKISFGGTFDYTFSLSYFKYDGRYHRKHTQLILQRILIKGNGSTHWDGSD